MRVATQAALLTALLVGSAVSTAADAPGAPTPIKDPHYGDTLFHFYQDNYFTALTSLMASQQFNRVAQHADEAELLRGGMLLSYGLHQEAGQIFANLLDKGAAPAVRDRAWFYLAKIRYQRGFLADAEDAIRRIQDALPAELDEDRLLLQSNLLMARSDYAGAVALLNGATAGKKEASPYIRFNLGVALIRSGDAKGGSELLEVLGRAPAANEELRSLRDKANVALGYSALQDDKPETARSHLERVRLVSLHANKALLGFGWAAVALKQPRLALVPWTELGQRDISDSAVLEARLAVPYAYAEIGAYGQSLEQYNDAITVFEREAANLDQSIAAIRSGKLISGLMERNPGEQMGWFWTINELPEMPHANHLTQVLAQHEFQEAFKNYRDLSFLARNLSEWQDKLGIFNDMLANRRKAYEVRLPEIRAKASSTGIEAQQQRLDSTRRRNGASRGTGRRHRICRCTRARAARAPGARAGHPQERRQHHRPRHGPSPRARRARGGCAHLAAGPSERRAPVGGQEGHAGHRWRVEGRPRARRRTRAGTARRARALRGLCQTHCRARPDHQGTRAARDRTQHRAAASGSRPGRGRTHTPERPTGRLRHASPLCRGAVVRPRQPAPAPEPAIGGRPWQEQAIALCTPWHWPWWWPAC